MMIFQVLDAALKEHVDIDVPNGKWVAQMHTQHLHRRNEFPTTGEPDEDGELNHGEDEHEHRRNKVIGVNVDELQMFTLDEKSVNHGSFSTEDRITLVVCDKPFGIVTTFEGGLYKGPLFTPARQIHKGELGQKPPIKKPNFVKEGRTEGGWKHGRRRGWAQLSELAALVNMTPDEVLARYWPFFDKLQMAMEVVIGDESKIKGAKDVVFCRYGNNVHGHVDNLYKLFELDPNNLWVRQVWTNVVLYMVHFGYVPEPAKV